MSLDLPPASGQNTRGRVLPPPVLTTLLCCTTLLPALMGVTWPGNQNLGGVAPRIVLDSPPIPALEGHTDEHTGNESRCAFCVDG